MNENHVFLSLHINLKYFNSIIISQAVLKNGLLQFSSLTTEVFEFRALYTLPYANF